MDGGMLEHYPSPADVRKQEVAELQARRQEKVMQACVVIPTAAVLQTHLAAVQNTDMACSEVSALDRAGLVCNP